VIDVESRHLLRRHVRRRADHGADLRRQIGRGIGVRCRRIGPHLRESEIEHFHPAVVAQDDVRRLQIAMDDAAIVGGGQRLRHGARDLDDARHRQRPLGDDPVQRTPRDELHRQEMHAVRVLD
jgi:hypothetical protein